ncbi:MAG TPA: IS5 family transposase [Pyrinomonadaceae bacterium]|jgi:transposase|nr:IS5 family transposase [Pyrinomonadaceae bacterium]
MRGTDTQQSSMFSYLSPEERVPANHPLRPIRTMVDVALKALSPAFGCLYSVFGRPSIPPEKLLRALLLQVLYTVRSERMLMEQLEYNLLFRWFVGLNMDEAVWVPTVFSKNRDRLLEGDIAEKFFAQVLEQARIANLLSDEHFSVDGTLIEAWASQKSFRRKDQPAPPPSDDPGNPTVDFHGEARSNETHESTTDPDARLARKSGGQESKLAYCGNVMIENRNGLVVDTELLRCSGTAERDAAMLMAERVEGVGPITLGADKGYDTKDFVKEMRGINVTPHVAQNDKRPGGSAIDGRTTRHAGYQVSQRKRKRIEEVFGWVKTVAMLRKTRHRGVETVGWVFTFTATAYNLVRMRNLLSPAVQSA